MKRESRRSGDRRALPVFKEAPRTDREVLAWGALAVALAAALPAPASAQVGGIIKKKVQQKVGRTVGGADTAAARPVSLGVPSSTGPVFTSNVLEITPELLHRLEKGLAAEAAMREENSRRIGKVLSGDDYRSCGTYSVHRPRYSSNGR